MSVHRSFDVDRELAAALGDLLAAFAPVDRPAATDDTVAAVLLGRAARVRSACAASALIGAAAAVLVPADHRSAVLPELFRLALPVLLGVHGSAKRQRLADAGPAIGALGAALAADPKRAASDRHLADFLDRLQGANEPAGADGADPAPPREPSPTAAGRDRPGGDGAPPSNPDSQPEQRT